MARQDVWMKQKAAVTKHCSEKAEADKIRSLISLVMFALNACAKEPTN